MAAGGVVVAMPRYEVGGKPLGCPVCGHGDFAWHEGLKESRGLTFLGWDAFASGVDKLTCGGCGHIMTFSRAKAIPNTPKKVHGRDDPDPYAGMHPDARREMGLD